MVMALIRFASVALAFVLAAFLHIAPAQAQCGEVLVYDVSRSGRLAAGADAAGCAITEAGGSDFITLLTEGDWEIVALDVPSIAPSGSWRAPLIEYVEAGGRLTISYWRMNDPEDLAAAFDVDPRGTLATMPATYAWLPEHRLFDTPNEVAMPLEWDDNGDRFEPVAGTLALAGLT